MFKGTVVITGNINICCQQRGCSTKKEKNVDEFGGEIIETDGGVYRRLLECSLQLCSSILTAHICLLFNDTQLIFYQSHVHANL